MSLLQVETAVEKFIKNERNDFLLIKGDWGVGKTHFWKKTIAGISKAGTVGHQHYAYISLFGIDSLESLKNAIVAAKIDSNTIWKNSDTSFSNLASDIKKDLSGLEKIPFLRNYTGGLVGDFAFKTVKNSIICFDDFERKSKSLEINEVLGLASLLKEQRNCKIVFISNNEKILGNEKDEFKQHSEKLIDIEVKFAPLAEEAFNYIFPKSYSYYDLLKRYCLTLDIRNLRTLQRIKRFIEDLQTYLDKAEKSVKEDIIQSLTLFVWCYYDKSENVPSMESVKNFSSATLYIKKEYKKEEITKEEERLANLLYRYGYTSITEFDEPLISLVEKGYLDTAAFLREFDKKNEQAIARKGNDTFYTAWELYNNSFSDNEDEFVKELILQFEKNIDFIELSGVDSSISTLRDLGKDVEADTMADKYVNKHSERFIPIFEETIFYRQIKDNYLREKIDNVIRNFHYEFDFAELIKKIAFKEHPEYEELKFLASQDEDDYYKFFKSVNSKDLYWYVKGCLRLEELNDQKGYRKAVATKAKEALKKISSENNLNRIKISRWFDL
jgi:hypothetical protein